MKMTSKIYANEILKDIKDCNRLIVSKRKKNADFMKKYALFDSDVKEYVENLDKDDFIEKKKNEDKKINAEYLYVFYKNLFLNDEYGDVLERVYIKLCKLKDKDGIIFVVSFHDEYNF